jgi:hypothetical protein
MPAPILTTASTVMCPHGGSVMLTTSNSVAKAEGSPLLLLTDMHTVSGCPFVLPPGTPSPCLTVRWLVGALQTSVNGTPVLLQTSVGLCFSGLQVPQGPPMIVNVQQQAMGT